MGWRPAGLLLSCFLGFGALAEAQVTVNKYKADISSGNEVTVALAKVYIVGFASGMDWMIARDVSENRTPAYCAPQKLSLTADNYIDILNRTIKTWENSPSTRDEVGNMLVGVLLFRGLQDTFPCPAKR